MTKSPTAPNDPADGKRPDVEYEFGPLARILHRGALAVGVVTAVAVIGRYWSLPDVVPIHFGFSGEPDGFGPRESVFLLAGIMLTLTVGMFFLTNRPRLFNYPTEVTERNAAGLYSAGASTMAWLGAALQLMHVGVASFYFGLNGSLLVALGAIATFATIIVGLARMARSA